ncbi:MAG: esterase/lipase family protein, partial [Woeseiaceae bacterium]
MAKVGPAHVICVHGMWMRGADANFLRERLAERYGYLTHQWHYKTVRASIEDNCRALQSLVEERLHHRQDAECHFVAHSLGGLVVLKMLADWADAPSGRVICLGTPLTDRAAALRVAALSDESALFGRLTDSEMPLGNSALQAQLHPRTIGSIAGTHCVNLGRRESGLSLPNDGAVTVAETLAPFVDASLEVAATHTGLLSSIEVTDQVAHFLMHGDFRAS